MNISGAVIAITGAAQGLGRAFALDLAERGARLALADVQAEPLKATRAACIERGAECAIWRVDVSNERQVMTLFEHIRSTFGGLDVLVNNAGITRDAPLVTHGADGGLVRHPLRQWREVVDVNLTGVFLCGREAAATMMAGERGGVIVNMSSITRVGNPGQSSYSATKAGVASLTVTWSRELSPVGIRVAAIAPGYMDTEMTRGVAPRQLQRLVNQTPAGRLGAVHEMTSALRFVLENDYVNGRIIEVDGGLRL